MHLLVFTFIAISQFELEPLFWMANFCGSPPHEAHCWTAVPLLVEA
jgi:hypothetical protein